MGGGGVVSSTVGAAATRSKSSTTAVAITWYTSRTCLFHVYPLLCDIKSIFVRIKIHSSCVRSTIYFVETHLCKLCVIAQSVS